MQTSSLLPIVHIRLLVSWVYPCDVSYILIWASEPVATNSEGT